MGAERPPRVRPLAGETDVADRVAVQRAAFESSTFSVPRWRLMAAGPAYDRQLDLLARDEDGTPVAAGTAWSAGPGRCGLLEPVGTHRDHQRRGHGPGWYEPCARRSRRPGPSSVAVADPCVEHPSRARLCEGGLRAAGHPHRDAPAGLSAATAASTSSAQPQDRVTPAPPWP